MFVIPAQAGILMHHTLALRSPIKLGMKIPRNLSSSLSILLVLANAFGQTAKSLTKVHQGQGLILTHLLMKAQIHP
jgi:hypothetical protein